MRTQHRNATPFFYAPFVSKTYVVDANGLKTGEVQITYGSAVKKCANISASKGQADPQLFGVDLNYTKTIMYADSLPIDEATAIWLGIDAYDYDATKTYSVGVYSVHNGKIYVCKAQTTGTWDSTKWDEVAHNYSVVGVAKSLNSTTLAVRKLN